MKEIALLAVFLILFTSNGCEKTSLIPNIYSGRVSANFNGNAWMYARATAGELRNIGNINKYGVSFSVYNEDEFLREVLSLSGISLDQSLYQPARSSPDARGEFSVLYSSIAEDGDVICEFFYPDTTYQNGFVEITLLDTLSGEVAGLFDLRFLREINATRNCLSRGPDTIVFTNGVFNTRIVGPG